MDATNIDFSRFYNFGLTTKKAMTEMINEVFSYRDTDGVLKQETVEVPAYISKKIVPIRCSCCGGRVVDNKCIYCDTEFYVER